MDEAGTRMVMMMIHIHVMDNVLLEVAEIYGIYKYLPVKTEIQEPVSNIKKVIPEWKEASPIIVGS